MTERDPFEGIMADLAEPDDLQVIAVTADIAEPSGQSSDQQPDPEPDQGNVDRWDKPAPLGITTAPEPFPMDALPGWLADFGQAVSQSLQTPPDLAGMLTLSALSAAAGGMVVVRVHADWTEQVNLYTSIALESATRKTPVYQRFAAPLQDFDRDEAKRMAAIIAEAITQRKVAERAAEQAQTAAGKATGPDAEAKLAEAIAAGMRAEAIMVPKAPRLLADDATPEALTSLLADSENGHIAVLSDEGGLFSMMAGKYSNGGGLHDLYLKAHAGTPMMVDRKGRAPERIDRPGLTIGLTVQPEVLRELGERQDLRGRGLLARFLYSLPVSTVGKRRRDAPFIPEELTRRYRVRLQALVRSLREERETARLAAEGEAPEPFVLSMLPASAELLLDLMDEIEGRLDPDQDGDLRHIAEWAGKLTGHVARISGLLHLAEHLQDDSSGGLLQPIGPATVAAAVRIGHYLIDHAVRVFNLMGTDPTLAAGREVLEAIKRKNLRSFTTRDLFSDLSRSRWEKVVQLDAPLALLEQHGYLRKLEPKPAGKPGRGRPASPTWLVNPAVWTA